MQAFDGKRVLSEVVMADHDEICRSRHGRVGTHMRATAEEGKHTIVSCHSWNKAILFGHANKESWLQGCTASKCRTNW